MTDSIQSSNDQTTALPDRLPRLCGADVELGNFILGQTSVLGSGGEASRMLLREIAGLPGNGGSTLEPYGYSPWQSQHGRWRDNTDWSSRRYASGASTNSWQSPGFFNPQDWGRKFLPANGGCVYIDLEHLELCQPEVLGAHEHLACWHAMLRIARQALQAANARLPAGQTLQVLVNNSDGQGNSYGSHLNFLLQRRTWDNLFQRKIHHLLYLAAFQVSSIVLTGQGKVGSENGAPAVAYQISQRADFFETLSGEQTTCHRPIVNSRDEALCGSGWYFAEQDRPAATRARLHVIFYDSNLCHAAHLLKVGLMQIMLTMLEAERIRPSLILDDPVAAVVLWSHDPTLHAQARLASGKKRSAVDLQRYFWDEMHRFVEAGGCDGVVPRARDILTLAHDTLRKLQAPSSTPWLAGSTGC